MASYSVETHPGEEHGITVECDEHGEKREFRPERRRGTFYCEGCDRELEVELSREDWRDLGEMC